MTGTIGLNMLEIVIVLPKFPWVVKDIVIIPTIIIVPGPVPVVVVAEVVPTEGESIVITDSASL